MTCITTLIITEVAKIYSARLCIYKYILLCYRGAKGNGVFLVDHVGMDIWLTTCLPWPSVSTHTVPSI